MTLCPHCLENGDAGNCLLPGPDQYDMPKTAKERQDDFRARRAILEGAQEVRGIFLPKEMHAELKEYAKKLQKRDSRKNPAEFRDD